MLHALSGFLPPIVTEPYGGGHRCSRDPGGELRSSSRLVVSGSRTYERISRFERVGRTRYTLYYRVPEGQVGALRQIESRVRIKEEIERRFTLPG